MNLLKKKFINESKGKPEQKIDAAFSFQRSKQKLHIDFSLDLCRLKVLKPFAHVKKVLIIGLKKIFNW